MKKYLPAIFLSIAFVLLLFFLNGRNSLNFTENLPPSVNPTTIPTPTETSWQTYRNEKYGFEFQYPENITYQSPDSKQIEYSNLLLTELNISNIDDEISTFKDFYKLTDFKRDTTTIDSYPAIRVGGISQIDNKLNYVSWVFFVKDKKHFGFMWYEMNGIKNEVFGQVLSTFKFLPDTSTWKTYKDSQYNFTMNYPNSWRVENFSDSNTFDLPLRNISFTSPNSNVQLTFGIRNNSEKIRTSSRTGVGSGETINTKTINFDGHLINRYVMKYNDYPCDDSYYTINSNLPQEFTLGNYSFTIDISNKNDYNLCSAPELEIIDQILSTFKFTNQKQSTIYTNTKYGYQLDPGAKLFGFNLKPDGDSGYWDNEQSGSPLGLSNSGYWLVSDTNNDPTALNMYKDLINLDIGKTGQIYKASLVKTADIDTDGVKGSVFSTKPTPGFVGESAYVYQAIWIKNNRAYILTLASQIELTRNSHKNDFNKILSSFKFTDTK